MYDFTVLSMKYYNEIEWEKLDRLIRSFGLTNNFQTYLYMAKELFGLTTPLTVDTKKARNDYKKILKSFDLRGTIRGDFYPLITKLKVEYSPEKIKKIYRYNNNFYYIFYVLKHIMYQLKDNLFCKGCLKTIRANW